jgi:EmrB/QacA subfamily drug resistance transporter
MPDRDEALAGSATAADTPAGLLVPGADPVSGASAPPERAQAGWRTRLPRTGHPGWLLAVCCVAQFMVILDLSIVNVALPSIQSSLGFSASQLQWVVDAYAIAFAGFLMFGGRATDQLGQRRTFTAALLVFGAASLAGGAAGSRETLIVARAIQGLGGALMAASSLAIITSSFPAGPARHRAIGMWGAMNGLGGAAGTLFGGIITQELTWRWVLLINPPIGVAAVLVGWRVIAERRRGDGAPSFDVAGALTLTIGQIVLVYGIVEASVFGWGSAHALVPIGAGAAVLALFGVIEARIATAPLVPFRELTRPLMSANGVVLLFSAALFPMWFVGSLYLQQVLGLSPLRTGLTFLPMALVIMLCARRAGALVGRFGVRPVLGGGLAMMAVAMLLFARIQPSGSAVAYIVVPGLLMAAGIGFSVVPSTIAAVQGAGEGQAGLASGLVNTSRQVGGGLGLALLITLATQFTTHLIGHNREVPSALTSGFRLAYLIGAGLCILAAVLAFTVVSQPVRPGLRPGRLLAGIALAVIAFAGLDFAVAGSQGAPIGAYTTNGAYRFVSAPALHPPIIRASTGASATLPGDVLLGDFYNMVDHPMIGQSGALILDGHLQPVWFHPVPTSEVASNLAPQTYHGRPALSWWQGVITNTGATQSGEDVVVDQHYRTVATLRATGGWVLTLHSLVIAGNDAWVTANRNRPMNLSRWGGAYNGALTDSAIQEYDLRSGRLLYSWDALRHIPLSQSYASLPSNGFPWDAYHVNSFQLAGDGTFLVSMRNTWAAYLVDIGSGRIDWTLGGKHSTFSLGRGAQFQWQHDVELHPGALVSMFDDHCCQITGGGTFVTPTGLSRGLELRLNPTARTATLLAQYTRADQADASYMGNAQPLAGGGVFVGWGSVPFFSAYAPGGRLVLDARLPGPDLSYRAYLDHWVGQPAQPPAGAVRTQGGRTTVYASWNGATEVASWRVLADRGGTFTPVATAGRTGFETAIAVPGGGTRFEVAALDASGRELGRSAAFGG